MFIVTQWYAIVNLERFDAVSIYPESDDDKRHVIYAWIGAEKRVPLGKYSFPRCVQVMDMLFKACKARACMRMPPE